MKSTNQLDLIRNSDEALAKANRVSAEAALYDPHFTPEERSRRAAHYLAEAARFERLAAGGRGPVLRGRDRSQEGASSVGQQSHPADV